MILHENTTLFREAVRFTAEQIGILDIYVEKDYWVTKALSLIFSDGIERKWFLKEVLRFPNVMD